MTKSPPSEYSPVDLAGKSVEGGDEARGAGGHVLKDQRRFVVRSVDQTKVEADALTKKRQTAGKNETGPELSAFFSYGRVIERRGGFGQHDGLFPVEDFHAPRPLEPAGQQIEDVVFKKREVLFRMDGKGKDGHAHGTGMGDASGKKHQKGQNYGYFTTELIR